MTLCQEASQTHPTAMSVAGSTPGEQVPEVTGGGWGLGAPSVPSRCTQALTAGPRLLSPAGTSRWPQAAQGEGSGWPRPRHAGPGRGEGGVQVTRVRVVTVISHEDTGQHTDPLGGQSFTLLG